MRRDLGLIGDGLPAGVDDDDRQVGGVELDVLAKRKWPITNTQKGQDDILHFNEL